MVRVVLYIATSLDGFIADKHGSVDWLPTPEDPSNDFGYNDFLNSVDVLAMGSITYNQILTFDCPWPYPNKKTFVFTRQKLETPAKQADVEFINCEPKTFIENLDSGSIKTVWLVGGSKLIDSFFNSGLIHDYIITIIPKMLGEGIQLPKQILERDGEKFTEQKCVNLGLDIRQNFFTTRKN